MLIVRGLTSNILPNLTATENGYYSTSTGNWLSSTNVYTYEDIRYTGSQITVKKSPGGNSGGYIAYFKPNGDWIDGHVFTFSNNEYEVNAPSTTSSIAITFWYNQSGTKIMLDGHTYPAEAKISRNRRVNGEREISLSFSWSDINDAFLKNIDTGWQVNFQGDWYYLFSPKEDKHGTKSFDGMLHFFHYFNGFWHIDEADGVSMTIDDSIAPLFVDKDYTLQIIDNFYANTMSYSKQQNNTERFLYFINRHEAEFEIPIGTKTVRLKNEIGTVRRDIMIHEDDNLLDLQIDTDTSSFCTAIRGYYDFDDDGNPQQNTEYISPMADKYGVYWGQPVVDDRFNNRDAVREACRKKQEGTWKTSFTLDAELFDTPLNEGDKIQLVFPSKSINMLIRVVEINETFDRDGELVGATYTFGNENISAQYRKMQYDAIQDVRDILNGKRPIPYSVLPAAVRQATEVINAGDTTQFYYRDNGIYGYDTENELGVTRYNANGIGFSRDGGETFSNAITYLGVVTEALTAGTIDANRITVYGSNGTNRISINGDRIRVWDSSEPDVYTEMTKGRIHANKGALSATRPDAYTDSEGKRYGDYIMDGIPRADMDVQRNQYMHPGVITWSGQRYILAGEDAQPNTMYNCETIYPTHKSKFITVGVGVTLEETSSSYITVEIVEIGTEVVKASFRQFVRSSDDTIWRNLTFDIGVPDYETNLAYYIRLGSSIMGQNTRVGMVPNRVTMHG